MAQSVSSEKSDYRIYKVGGWAAILMLFIMVAQIAIFIAFPPPETAQGFFDLFDKSKILGLLSMDLLYLINNAVLIIIYLALFVSLKETHKTSAFIALAFGLVGIAAYYVSNTSLEMLTVSNQYRLATSAIDRAALLAVGNGLFATYKGTAFTIYYFFNAITLLLFAFAMLRTPFYSKSIGVIGLISGVFMSIPSTFGTIGLIFSLASLVPWAVFLVMITKKFFQKQK